MSQYTFSIIQTVWFSLMVFNDSSIVFQLYCDGQFYWWRKWEYLEKTTEMSEVTDKLYNSSRKKPIGFRVKIVKCPCI